jgi:hypothetical protein
MSKIDDITPKDVEKFINENLNDNQKRCKSICGTYFPSICEKDYMDGMYFYYKKNMLNSQYFLVCAFVKLRGDIFNQEVEPKQLHGELKSFLEKTRPTLSQRYIDDKITKLRTAYKKMQLFKHGKPDDDIFKYITDIENFLICFEQLYIDNKRILDNILAKADESPYQKPTEDEIKKTIDNMKGNLKQYFLSKLENPEWIQPLKEKNLLYFCKSSDKNGNNIITWDALPYLIKVAPEKPDEVLGVINPFLIDLSKDKNNDINIQILLGVIEIGIAMAKNKKGNLLKISDAFLSWLKQNNSFAGDWFDYNNIVSKLLQTLIDIGYEKTAFEIFSELLSLRIVTKKSDFPSIDGEGLKDFVVFTKFGAGNNMMEYYYKEILNKGSEVFKTEPKKLFEIYFDIIKNLLSNNSLTDKENKRFLYKINFHRPAIEDHSQNDCRKNEPFNIILSAFRDTAKILLKTSEKNNIDFVLKTLKKTESTSAIFLRLILHLLRLFPSADKNLIESYLTKKNYFDNSNIRHEYYLLMHQEFEKLPKQKQNIIFKFIDDGPDPKDDWYQTDDEYGTSKKKIRLWKLCRLEPIRDALSDDEKKKYKDVLIQDGKDQHCQSCEEHFDASKITWGTSPIEDSEMKKISSIDEIIKNLKYWKPSGIDMRSLSYPTVRGLAKVLAKDINQNPQKYLDNILKFKEIAEPIYISYLFSALDFSDIRKSVTHLENIIELGLWVIKQESPKDRKRDYFEGYIDWNDVYTDVLRLFEQIYDSKTDKELELEDNLAKKLFKIINTLVFAPDDYLSPKEAKNNNDYYTSAINSLHGVAVESLIKYVLWRKRQGKKIGCTGLILNALLNESKYPETWAVLGRFLPWINMMFPDWTAKNIDKILPEGEDNESRNKFNAAWITYIELVNPFSDMFVLLKPKFEYVLRNKPYKQEVEGIGKHIAVYYARERIINLNDESMKVLFNKPENDKERGSLISFIGSSLKDSKKEDVPQEVIDKFKILWDWWVEKIEKKEIRLKNAKKTLKEFQLNNAQVLKWFQSWYICKHFEKEWAISQIHDLIVKKEISMDICMIEEVLLEDLPKYTRKVFEIIRVLSANDEYLSFHLQPIIEVVKYIKDNKFENDSKLKEEKDDFINKLSEISHNGYVSFDELKEYLE